jgi:hypothetical protein
VRADIDLSAQCTSRTTSCCVVTERVAAVDNAIDETGPSCRTSCETPSALLDLSSTTHLRVASKGDVHRAALGGLCADLKAVLEPAKVFP